MVDWDVAVVGAGPAGSLAALSALRASPRARVLILDRDTFPRDKVCGDAIGARSFEHLASHGLAGMLDDYAAANEMALSSRVLEARRSLPWAFRVVPRRVLDARLLQAAIDAGAAFQQRRVRQLSVGAASVTLDGEVEAAAVVGADGAESVVRRYVDGETRRPVEMAVAVRGYGPSTSQIPRVVSLGTRWMAYAWEFPIGDGTSNVGYIESPRGREITREHLIGTAHELLPHAARNVDAWRGHRLPLASARSRIPDGRLLLAGDAAALINPTSGEGILDAVVSGSLSGEAALFGASAGAAYRASLRRALGRHRRHSWVAAQACRIDALAALGLRMADADQRFFDNVLDVSMGDGVIRPLTAFRATARVASRGILEARNAPTTSSPSS